MTRVTIYSKFTRKPLFSGEYSDFSTCLEDAVRRDADLTGADLRNKNLSNITLDEAHMPHADFSGSNLSGANISEALLSYADFRSTDLYNTCLAWSQLQCCNFEDANFGATNIDGATITRSRFSGLSCFDLDFTTTTHMQNCCYIDPENQMTRFSTPPLVVKGLTKPLILLDKNKRKSDPFTAFFMALHTLQAENSSIMVE